MLPSMPTCHLTPAAGITGPAQLTIAGGDRVLADTTVELDGDAGVVRSGDAALAGLGWQRAGDWRHGLGGRWETTVRAAREVHPNG